MDFFKPPSPAPGLAPKKKAGTPCRNFFLPRGIFFTVCYLDLHVTFTLLHCMTLVHELLLT